MAWRSTRPPSYSQSGAIISTSSVGLVFTFLVLIMAAVGSHAANSQCKAEICTRLYNDAMDINNVQTPEPTAAFCRVLRDYGSCIRTTARSCRGNLAYHSTSTLVHVLTAEFNCSSLLAVGNTAHGMLPVPVTSAAPAYETAPVVTDGGGGGGHRHHHKCEFKGRHKFRHCGLFGDPHLKTFDNEYQTCRVKGAWPLIDNAYLAVQVTNEPVVDGSPATATTKVTIIIRGQATSCTPEKTYEAQSDTPGLPTLFIDGTHRSGPDESVTLTDYDQGTRVEIYLRYIETTLIVRQVGKYLAFSARMPEELVQTRAYASDLTSDSLQLCMRGCPVTEVLNPVEARGHALPWHAAVAKCRKSDGYSNDINNNLTDHYLDWCVFDVMTTGDGAASDDFAAAAHSAQADVIRLDPMSLKNRTNTHEFMPGYSTYSGASNQAKDLLTRTIWLLVLLIALSVHRRQY